MKTLLVSIVTSVGLMLAGSAFAAAAPSGAPAGTTGMCKDGTYSSAAEKKGACRGHKGVKDWYAGTDTSSASGASSNDATTTGKSKSKATSSASTSTTSTASSATPPAGATGLCNDGTYYDGATKKGACRGHKGVKTWYGSTTSTGSTPAAAPAAAPAPAATPASPAMTMKTPPASTPTTTSKAPAATTAATTPAAGGGPGKVWVNTSSKVYHCQGDRYYGTTKQGEYMSEADAVAKGNRAAHGKSCSS